MLHGNRLMNNDFLLVTEIAGDDVTNEQVERLCHRYYWAGEYCTDKEVVEVACGTGQGVGYLAHRSRSFEAGDYSEKILEIAKSHYGESVKLTQFDALDMPYGDESKDVIIIFEAIYYLPYFEKFVKECKRVLRKNGRLLIATANKDLYDFNSSPHSFKYYGVLELNNILVQRGFSCEFFGYLPVINVWLRQKMLRPLKKIAISLNLMPKTMAGKKIFKRIMFGKLVKMPAEISEGQCDYTSPVSLDVSTSDKYHKVIYCCATL